MRSCQFRPEKRKSILELGTWMEVWSACFGYVWTDRYGRFLNASSGFLSTGLRLLDIAGHDKAVKQLSFLSVSAACHISTATCNSPMQQARATANPTLSSLSFRSITQRLPDVAHRLFLLLARDESKTETAGKWQKWYMSERCCCIGKTESVFGVGGGEMGDECKTWRHTSFPTCIT